VLSFLYDSRPLGQIWVDRKQTVREKAQSARSRIHLVVDIWTFQNRRLLGMCAHFVDNQNNLTKALLGLPEVETHSGQAQFTTLLPILREYGIVRNVGAIVADNSSMNDTLCRGAYIHPSRRKAYIERNWRLEWRGPALGNVKKLWGSYRRATSVPSCTSVTEGSKNLSVFEQIGKKLDNVDQRPGSKDEFDDYADREPCPPLDISLPFNGGVKMPKGSAGQDYH